jgi:hypothetical protein
VRQSAGFERLIEPGSHHRRRGGRGEQAKLAVRGPTQRESHILGDRQIGEQVGDLEGAADAEVRAPVRRHARDVAPLQEHATRGRPDHTGDGVEEGGLAGTVRPDHGASLAFAQAQRNTFDRRQCAEADAHVLELQNRRGHVDDNPMQMGPMRWAAGLDRLCPLSSQLLMPWKVRE